MKPRFLEILRRNEAFLGLRDELLLKIADLPSCRLARYKRGEAIFRVGQRGESLALLASGSVDITVPVTTGSGTHREVVVDSVHQGSILGWSSMVPPYMFTRNAIAAAECELLMVDAGELRALMTEEPQIGYELAMAILRVLHSRYLHVQHLLASGRRMVVI